MKYLTRCASFLAAVTAATFAIPAQAALWEWSFPSAGCDNVAVCSFNSTFGTSSQTLKIHAFSTPTLATSGGLAPQTGNWKAGKIYNYDGNLGITNTVANDIGEGGSPEHAVDNNQVYDIMIFELPKGFEWDIEAFRLGWAHEGEGCGTGCPSGAADIQAWFGGGESTIDWTQVCFSGCTGTAKTLTGTGATALGFKDVTDYMLSPAGSPGDNNVPAGYKIPFDQTVSATQNGRYLVMTGALGQKLDAFKPEMIKADGNKIPLPGTLALLGLGLFGLVTFRHRQSRAS